MSWLGNVARWRVIDWFIEPIRLGRLHSVRGYIERGQLSRGQLQVLQSLVQKGLAVSEFDMPAPSKPDSDYTAGSQGDDDRNEIRSTYLH